MTPSDERSGLAVSDPPATLSSLQAQPPDRAWPGPGTTPRRPEAVLVFLVAALAFLLASSPARNSDLWMHLARGQLLVHGARSLATGAPIPAELQRNTGWLYDLLCYGLYAAVGGTGLVLAKALLIVALALLMVRLSRTSPGWWVPIFCTTVALLAMSIHLPLQPVTISCLFLALTLWLLRDRGLAAGGAGVSPAGADRRDAGPTGADRRDAGPTGAILDPRSSILDPRAWPLLVLFVVWVNLDSWFVLGLATVALVWLGQFVDLAIQGDRRWLTLAPRRLASLFLLAVACLLNPAHLYAFVPPSEMGWSPYWNYLATMRLSAAGLAGVPLMALTLLSFVLNLPRWHWRWFLPWLGLAVLSAVQVRAVPFFAVVSGPVLAWNLQELFAPSPTRTWQQRPLWRGSIGAGHALTALLVLLLPLCAWPGWLQSPPFEPRRWAVEVSSSLEKGAATTRRWYQQGRFGRDGRGLHLAPETAHAFAWFCPEENGVQDAGLAAAIRGEPGAPADWQERMRAAGINHVILYDTDRGRLCATMDRLLEDQRPGQRRQWPLLYLEGSLAVFGWRDPAAPAESDPFQGRQLDLNHLAFHPLADKKAPEQPSEREPEPRQWWDAFWKPVPPRLIDREEATLHLFHAELLRRSAPRRHRAVWDKCQAAALVGAAGGWTGPGALLDARLRLALAPAGQAFQPDSLAGQAGKPDLRPDLLPVPEQIAYTLRQQFGLPRDDTPPALLYLAVRAARRALAVNPDDAQAYLILGESYLRLLRTTRERAWGQQVPELIQLRLAQASAALNQAVTLKPSFARAHLSLGRLYQEMGYWDLTLKHLRAYAEWSDKEGVPPEDIAQLFRGEMGWPLEDLSRLADEVKKRDNKHTVMSAGLSVLARAAKAQEMGLAGKARDMLLESNIAAFGPRGMSLELDLLLRTGRAKEVWEWTGELSADHKRDLGVSYHWLRAQALAARGDYVRAEEECNHLSGSLAQGPQGPRPVPYRPLMAVLVGSWVLREQSGATNGMDLLVLNMQRSQFRDRLQGLSQGLKREADLTVLRGLLLLEQGDVEEAEIAFREALALWKDETAAARGAGLDFQSRGIAQTCVEWLQ